MTRGGEPGKLVLPRFGERQSLREQVAVALRAALVAGEMRPGVVYSAPALAQKFGVSPTPVREAMLDLAKEGLIETARNKGFRVRELSDVDLDEIASIRALIEVPTVAEIAASGDARMSVDVEALRPLAREIVSCAVESDLIAFIEADRRFHLSMLALAGNRQLVEVVDRLCARSRLYGLDSLAQRGELASSAAEHEELVNLVLAGDADGAAVLMRRHIGHVRRTWANRDEE